MPEHSEGRQRLTEYGMTDDEIGLWFALADLAGRFLQLPVLHPSERSETAIEIHRIQNILLARPGLRAVGWPR